jgi:pseudaminic acid biosynthesis-associated methylase
MPKVADQIQNWTGSFGREYTDRNALSLEEMEAMYESRYGLTRTELNERFLAEVDRSSRILEVGSNIGNQLLCLQQMGFQSLYGIEVQGYAVELSKCRTSHINIIEGSAFDIPYKDSYFDLVFTSGVLIHLHPSDVAEAMKEIHRCTKWYIWGFEYYAEKYTPVSYRGHENLLWKTDFARLYLENFDDVQLVKEERLQHLDSNNVDSMFLLRKI